MDAAMKQIWTMGHWVCPQDVFIETLQAADIEMLVDVRSHPGSRRSPQFSIEQMPVWLGQVGIDYVHLAELGGRRPRQHEVDEQINAGWHNASFKNYADYSLTSGYAAGLSKLLRLASEHNVCIMCGEPMPWRCHRSLIANDLTARGWTVWHLSTTDKPRRHQLGAWGATPVISADGTITYPEPTASSQA